MTETSLALAVNGREHHLRERLVAYSPADVPGRGWSAVDSVAVVGLGYVGLPTAFGLCEAALHVTGIDTSDSRLAAIERGEVDLPECEQARLVDAVAAGGLRLTGDPAVLGEADAVIICVPTPVDEQHTPDPMALNQACATVVAHAHQGQTIILTSTSFVGTTRSLLTEPLEQRGLTVGTDVHVAFSPERIDPGNPEHHHSRTPRIVGGATAACATRAASVIENVTDSVYLVGSPEAAELTKLYENIFRAVTLALANEFSDICAHFGLDPIEVTLAAGTKPYGFLAGFPGPGVGGHCIPCDPHYLLWQLRQHEQAAPLIEQTMRSIERRPERVVERALQVLAEADVEPARARVLLVGVSYKAGVRDLRESPALPILSGLARHGVHVAYHDPLLPHVPLQDGTRLTNQEAPDARQWDLAVIHTVHPEIDYRWVRDCARVLDATYRFDLVPHRQLV
ncbi:nucleotide sugar dehydrogenase [Halopolyspora algeriensis]|uniref:Nucleotide sugar dehydrogenase n=1 Tax=Halopolyspora algeriensis TaxID=1500506 RepID=A0A368VW72_9ACTN|nr:nucleotide sugar dehydrogenase [Halopolyspora algeriensis]RCW44427.1 nucleotide sugar dehydrogenase [Halopolyspora algeriensis]TQM55788.1 nucleotide sugar dehydrogenase [Halopolyspora algeriensis]